MSSQKLWVQYVTPARTFGPTRVSIDGCEDVADFKGIIGNINF
jgi:S-formylglutathione hydrolase FrmB